MSMLRLRRNDSNKRAADDLIKRAMSMMRLRRSSSDSDDDPSGDLVPRPVRGPSMMRLKRRLRSNQDQIPSFLSKFFDEMMVIKFCKIYQELC